MAGAEAAHTLSVKSEGKTELLSFNNGWFTIGNPSSAKKVVQIPLRQVLSARVLDSSIVDVSFLQRKRKKGTLVLVRFKGTIQKANSEAATQWADSLTDAAYEGVKRNRHLKVLVNPFGGQGKAVSIFHKKVEPILTAAGCVIDVVHTTHPSHAHEIAKDLPLDKYDAVVTLSGDGLIHEVINGLAAHAEPTRALRMPVAPVPTGSANGTCINLLGLEDGFNIACATLNAIKGQPMHVDMFSMLQQGKRTLSFMSQALGLMADLDIGTQHLRWMGDSRFMYGYIRGVMQSKACPIELSIKVAEDDKMKLVEGFQRRRETPTSTPETDKDLEAQELPALKYTLQDEDGWMTFKKPISFVYAGKAPFVGRDLMAFPVSLPDDGFIDIFVCELGSRGQALKSIDGAEKGLPYWHDHVYYCKAHAYRVKPLKPKGCISIDGEEFPFEPFQVEVHQGLGTLMSPYGYYVSEFDLPENKKQPSKTTAS